MIYSAIEVQCFGSRPHAYNREKTKWPFCQISASQTETSSERPVCGTAGSEL